MRRALQALGTGLSRQAAREEALAGASSRCSSSAPDFAHASGAPLQYYTRKAIISSPSRNAMQSGKGNTAFGVSPTWKIDFEQKVTLVVSWSLEMRPRGPLRASPAVGVCIEGSPLSLRHGRHPAGPQIK